MNEPPKISIVTPSFNQGAFLGETLQSLVDQGYTNLEVIIQDGGSTDQSRSVAEAFAREHPGIFKFFAEADEGQADALNRGFAKTSGEILGFLNSDDLLLPNCLHRVAAEIDPNSNRYIVFGRSVFFGNDPSKEGQDHPCNYTSHFEQLAIWKRRYNQIPQPSTFWHRAVWENCGPIDASISHALDYDLFCRFSQKYRFHKVPELWSRFRLHESSKTVKKSRDRLIEECIEISRRYWGPWWTPLRWRCSISHGLYQRSRRPQAIDAVRKAESALLQGNRFTAFFLSAAAAWKAPLQLGPRILYPIAATRGWTGAARFFQAEPPVALCPNQWIGPFYETTISTREAADQIEIEIEVPSQFSDCDFRVTVRTGDTEYSLWEKQPDSRWRLRIPAPQTNSGRAHIVFSCSHYFIPALSGENDDTRFLSVRLHALHCRPANLESVS